MKTSKYLMGVILSAVLLFSSAFAINTDKQISLKYKYTIAPSNDNRDCSACEFDWSAYGSECCDSAFDEFGINCATLEGTYGWDCAGCECPGDAPGECGDGVCNVNEDCETCEADCGVCGECGDGQVPDCADNDCCPESWIGDGFTDCEDQQYGCDLTCYDNDGGDCADPVCGDGSCNGDETYETCPEDCSAPGSECSEDFCAEGTYWDGFSCYDCSYCTDISDDSACDDPYDCCGMCGGTADGTCGDPVCGDGYCTGDEDYMTCPEDCLAPGECDDGYITDCADDDCCPESWIGDGFEDCEDQAFGCDLTCYDNDGGDCPEDCPSYTCWDGSCVDDMANCPDEPDVPEPTGVCIAGENYAGYPAVTVSWDIETACGDGVCNGDESWDNCPEDCNEPGTCNDGEVVDCDGSGECWPESWIGDGFADCQDQAYGADLTCYDCDGGDCPDSDPGCGGTAECGDGYCNGDETEASCPEDCASSGSCDDCEFDWSAYGSECCDTAWDDFGIDCATLESTYGWDCSGCNCPGDGAACPDGQTECWDGSCVADPADCPEQGGCVETFVVTGSDPSTGDCWSDGTGYFNFTWEGECLATYIEYSAGGMDLTTYGFTQGFMFYGFDPGACEDFVIIFEDGSVAEGSVCNDCATCDELGQITCWDGSCADTEADCPEEGTCPDGQIIDCDGTNECWPESWIGDGFADCQDQAYGADLTCYDCDGGDCPSTDPGCSSCADQGLIECDDGSCAATTDDCPEPEGCPAGTVDDCSGDGDCCFESWIGDGLYCDDGYQNGGACDLTCYDNDGGDCDGRSADYGKPSFKRGQEPTTFAALQPGRTVDVIKVEKQSAISLRDGVVVGGGQAVRVDEEINSSTRALTATVALSCDACLYGEAWSGEWIVAAMDFGYFTVYGFDAGADVCGTVTFCEDTNGACSETSDQVCAVAGDADSVDCVEGGSDCPSEAGSGDVNGDGDSNVLDIVTIVNVILGGEFADECAAAAADVNGDGQANVLDIVQIVNGILGGRVDDASSAKLIKSDEAVILEANGYIGGVQMTLSHDGDFSIDLTDKAMVAEYNTVGNQTILVIVAPEGEELFTYTGDFEIVDMIIANSQDRVNVGAPTEFSLSTAYPNPFNPTTSLELSVPMNGQVTVQVYNLMGQVVATLANGYMDASTYTLTWDASNVSSGMYIVKAEAAGTVSTQKLMLMK